MQPFRREASRAMAAVVLLARLPSPEKREVGDEGATDVDPA